MRIFLVLILFVQSFSVLAEKPVGFLWYNIEREQKAEASKKDKAIAFSQLSYTQKDSILRFYTMEALHKARHTKSVKDMRVFLSLQDYWMKESSRFSAVFQQTMLAYPEYDYTVTHPTSSMGARITDEVREKERASVIESLSRSHGLLFFYRGKSLEDVRQIPIVRDFCIRFNLPWMPVSVDGVTADELVTSRIDHGQANTLGVRFFPALLLVNPKSQKTMPVAYGLITQDVLEKRLYQVATQFKGEA